MGNLSHSIPWNTGISNARRFLLRRHSFRWSIFSHARTVKGRTASLPLLYTIFFFEFYVIFWRCCYVNFKELMNEREHIFASEKSRERCASEHFSERNQGNFEEKETCASDFFLTHFRARTQIFL